MSRADLQSGALHSSADTDAPHSRPEQPFLAHGSVTHALRFAWRAASARTQGPPHRPNPAAESTAGGRPSPVAHNKFTLKHHFKSLTKH